MKIDAFIYLFIYLFMRNQVIQLENIAKSEPRNVCKSVKKLYNQGTINQGIPIKRQDFMITLKMYMNMLYKR